MSKAISDMGEHSSEYGKNIVDAGRGSVKTGADVYRVGTGLSKLKLAFTAGLVKTEWDYGSRNLNLAWERFYKGNMTLTQRTAEDRRALSAVPVSKEEMTRIIETLPGQLPTEARSGNAAP